MTIEELVRGVYAALVSGDRDALLDLLQPDFEGTLSAGMPFEIGGVHRGAEAMIRDGWWAIGRAFAVRPEPREWIPCADGRLLVLGRYAGHARADRAPVDAAFAHVWTARDGRLSAVQQVTDTARWAGY